jgi:RHS repeat-associated protein
MVYDAAGVLYADEDGMGAVQVRYLPGVGGPDLWVARVDASGPAFLLGDYQGSVRIVTNGGGAVLDQVSYDAFGNIISETDPAARGRLGFQGGELDSATGTLHFGAREYSPEMMRWNRLDPLGFGGGDSNEYRFVGNAPTDGTDPTGQYIFADRRTTIEARDIGEWFNKVSQGKLHVGRVGLPAGKVFLSVAESAKQVRAVQDSLEAEGKLGGPYYQSLFRALASPDWNLEVSKPGRSESLGRISWTEDTVERFKDSVPGIAGSGAAASPADLAAIAQSREELAASAAALADAQAALTRAREAYKADTSDANSRRLTEQQAAMQRLVAPSSVRHTGC